METKYCLIKSFTIKYKILTSHSFTYRKSCLKRATKKQNRKHKIGKHTNQTLITFCSLEVQINADILMLLISVFHICEV